MKELLNEEEIKKKAMKTKKRWWRSRNARRIEREASEEKWDEDNGVTERWYQKQMTYKQMRSRKKKASGKKEVAGFFGRNRHKKRKTREVVEKRREMEKIKEMESAKTKVEGFFFFGEAGKNERSGREEE